MKIQYLPENTLGRDFVVGDIHGCFSLVDAALAAASFDPAKDRLLCVGDLIDRGPESADVLDFLARPYVHAVRGNHEDAILEGYGYLPEMVDQVDVDCLPEGAKHMLFGRMGADWWLSLDQPKRKAIVEAFLRLPLVIEVPTRRGTVGLVHAEVPSGMDWGTFKQKIEAVDEHTTKSALWGRIRHKFQDNRGVRGIGRVFCGHTIQDGVTQRGNTYFVDTGAVSGQTNPNSLRHLSMANIAVATQVLISHEERPTPFINISDGDVSNAAFGVYAAEAPTLNPTPL